MCEARPRQAPSAPERSFPGRQPGESCPALCRPPKRRAARASPLPPVGQDSTETLWRHPALPPLLTGSSVRALGALLRGRSPLPEALPRGPSCLLLHRLLCFCLRLGPGATGPAFGALCLDSHCLGRGRRAPAAGPAPWAVNGGSFPSFQAPCDTLSSPHPEAEARCPHCIRTDRGKLWPGSFCLRHGIRKLREGDFFSLNSFRLKYYLIWRPKKKS